MRCAIGCSGSISMSRAKQRNSSPPPPETRHHEWVHAGRGGLKRGLVETDSALAQRVWAAVRCYRGHCRPGNHLGCLYPKKREGSSQPLLVSAPAKHGEKRELLGQRLRPATAQKTKTPESEESYPG